MRKKGTESAVAFGRISILNVPVGVLGGRGPWRVAGANGCVWEPAVPGGGPPGWPVPHLRSCANSAVDEALSPKPHEWDGVCQTSIHEMQKQNQIWKCMSAAVGDRCSLTGFAASL